MCRLSRKSGWFDGTINGDECVTSCDSKYLKARINDQIKVIRVLQEEDSDPDHTVRIQTLEWVVDLIDLITASEVVS